MLNINTSIDRSEIPGRSYQLSIRLDLSSAWFGRFKIAAWQFLSSMLNQIGSIFPCLPFIGLLALGLISTGCTINVYHADSEGHSTAVLGRKSNSSCSNTCVEDGEIRHIDASKINATSVLEMNAEKAPGVSTYEVGDSVTLNVRSSVDAYVHCYYQMANKDIVKIFPNAQNAKSWLYSGQLVSIPERATFNIVPDTPNVTESFMCLAIGEDPSGKLPLYLREALLKPLPVFSFDDVYRIYRESTLGNLAGRVVSVSVL